MGILVRGTQDSITSLWGCHSASRSLYYADNSTGSARTWEAEGYQVVSLIIVLLSTNRGKPFNCENCEKLYLRKYFFKDLPQTVQLQNCIQKYANEKGQQENISES